MARRRWELDLADGRHVVELVHGYLSGTRTITVDGVTTKQRGTALSDNSGVHPFPFVGHKAALHISSNGLNYRYDLILDGRSVGSGKPATFTRPYFGEPTAQMIFGFLMIAISLPILLLSGKTAYEEWRYHTDAAGAVAVVEDRRVVAGRTTSYEVSYAFSDRTGALRHGRGSVSRTAYAQAAPGRGVRVEYLPEAPDTNRFTGRDETWNIVFVIAIEAFALGIGLHLLARGMRRRGFLRRFATMGASITATVTKATTVTVGGYGRVVMLEYTYDDAEGRARRGRSPYMYPAEADRYPVGSPVRIVIDPNRPGESYLPPGPIGEG